MTGIDWDGIIRDIQVHRRVLRDAAAEETIYTDSFRFRATMLERRLRDALEAVGEIETFGEEPPY